MKAFIYALSPFQFYCMILGVSIAAALIANAIAERFRK